ncbi:MAG: lactate racemase domain-containing protein [Candidatus Bathyarchaeota archaeon]|nr:lactate racemase domain-containing protein [Candidatus Bathyarchaeota archaeon]
MIKLVDCWLPYGDTEIYVSIEMDNLIKILEPIKAEEPKQIGDVLLKALDEPTGAGTLEQLVGPDCRVAIAVDASMNPQTACQILSAVVKQLVELIVPRDRITIILGDIMRDNGNNRLVEAIREKSGLSQVRVIDNTRSSSGHVDLGETRAGTPVRINREYHEATLKIAVGDVTVDSHTGFKGAHSAVIPGIASPQTLLENRRNYFKGAVSPGVIELNPVKEDQMEAVKMAGIDFAVNAASDPAGEFIDVFCGGFEESWGKAVTALEGCYEFMVDGVSDITMVSAGGGRYDYNLYSASMALKEASRVTKRNGAIILLAECSEGLGADAFNKLSRVMELSEFGRRYTYGAEALQLIKQITRNQRVILVSALPQYIVESIGIEPAKTANEAYTMAITGRRARGTYVIPYGSTCKLVV